MINGIIGSLIKILALVGGKIFKAHGLFKNEIKMQLPAMVTGRHQCSYFAGKPFYDILWGHFNPLLSNG